MTAKKLLTRAVVVTAALLMVTCELVTVMAAADGTGPRATAPANPVSAPAADTAPLLPDSEVVDLPVEFEVVNRNRTASQCTSDGKPYTLRGHLTAPRSVLETATGDGGADAAPAVTLYVHGTNTGEWVWRLDPPGPRAGLTHELARRGHASVTIDRLGYGSSDIPDGFASCSGAHADMAHQIVQQVRSGSYTVREMPRGTDGRPRFGQVFLAGHSSGALVAETVAASFEGAVDGLLLTGWAAVGVTGETNRRFLAAYAVCQQGGEPKDKAGDPKGYVHFDPVREDFLAGGFGPGTDPEVLADVAPLWPRNPCGVMASEPAGILTDLQLIGRIETPVFLAFGAEDVLRQGVEGYPALFTASDDVRTVTLADSGHFVTLDQDAARLQDEMDGWLDTHLD
ncbi:alpha/beta fold hydrolase [Streptomyces sp. NPDC093252]|uniref:alpha/beta hydrolase n=1 Tax=Streptomyces sp. NPDC093252 TaxID=3154980 RepID=UPI0034432FD9